LIPLINTGRDLVAFIKTNSYIMKTIVVLTDFSEEAFRAAEFACEIADCLQIKKIVLYNAHAAVVAYGGSTDGAAIVSDDHELYLENMESLGLLQDRLKPLVAKDIMFEMIADNTGIPGIADWIERQKQEGESGLLVLGASHKSGFEKWLDGSTTKEVLKKNEWPVLVVPGNTYLGRSIDTLVFASDMKEIEDLPTNLIHEVLNAFPAKLHLLHVQKESEDEPMVEREKAVVALHELLDTYDPEFHYRTCNDIAEGILTFATKEKASLIITVHRKHGFWQSIFSESVTRKLAEKTNIPLLSLPGLS
jgi:nucleotide-binding universal stress UspA family protein